MEALSKQERQELITYILKRIELTHNDKDREDLHTFSDDELVTIYSNIVDLDQ
jgi:hypothetical protein